MQRPNPGSISETRVAAAAAGAFSVTPAPQPRANSRLTDPDRRVPPATARMSAISPSLTRARKIFLRNCRKPRHTCTRRHDRARPDRAQPGRGLRNCLMSATPLAGLRVLEFTPYGHGADRRADLRRARRRRDQGRAGAARRSHARARRVRGRVLRRLQPQQAQPRGRSEAAARARP